MFEEVTEILLELLPRVPRPQAPPILTPVPPEPLIDMAPLDE